MNYVIIGNGIAGMNAVRGIRELDPSGPVTVVTQEDTSTYSRVRIAEIIQDRSALRDLVLASEQYYESLGVHVMSRVRVTSVDVSNKIIATRDGRYIPYDRLLLASGATPTVPDSLEGREHAFMLRTIDDAISIEKAARRAKRAMIVGGGLVGMKVCAALHRLGVRVVFVVSSGRMLSTVLNDVASEIVMEHMKNRGVEVRLNSDVTNILPSTGLRNGVLEVSMADGTIESCDLVVLGKGVKPSVGFLRDSNIEIAEGVLVDPGMHTSDPAVYAAGDVTQSYDEFSQIHVICPEWPRAAMQGYVAGVNMAGGKKTFRGWLRMNSFDALGLHIVSFGSLLKTGESDPMRTTIEYRCSGSDYGCLAVESSRIVGGIFIGNTQDAWLPYRLAMSNQEVSTSEISDILRGIVSTRTIMVSPARLNQAYVLSG